MDSAVTLGELVFQCEQVHRFHILAQPSPLILKADMGLGEGALFVAVVHLRNKVVLLLKGIDYDIT